MAATGAWGLGCWWGVAGAGAALPASLPSAGLQLAALALWITTVTTTSASRLALGLAFLVPLGWALGHDAVSPAPLRLLEDHQLGLAGPWRLQGTIEREPEPGERGSSRFTLRVDRVFVDGSWRSWPGRVQVRAPEPPPEELLPGHRVEAFLRLRRDRPPANPGQRRPDALLVAGIDARTTIKSYRQLRRLAKPNRGRMSALPGRARVAIRASITTRFRRQVPLVRALLLGERDEVDDRTGSLLVRSGLIHLLAISGLHVGLLLGFAVLAARALGARPDLALGVALASLAAIVLLVVPRPSVLRAILMAVSILSGRLLGRRVAALDGLALGVFLLVLIDPLSTHDRGLHLSVLATLGILLRRFDVGPGLQRAIPALFSVTLAAQAAVVPLLAATSRQIALAGLLLNVPGILLLSLLLPLLIATVACDLIGLGMLGAPLARLGEIALDAIVWLAATGARDPCWTLTVPSMSWPLAWLCWAGLAGLRLADGTGRWLAAAALAAAVIVALRSPPAPNPPELLALDVGQGDALFVQTETGAVLIDAGGYPGVDYDTGTHIVAPVLRYRGVRHLAAAATTHAHADHAGGIPSILRDFTVREAWVGTTPLAAPYGREILRAASDRSVVTLSPAGTRSIAGCRWKALLPDTPELLRGARDIENDASLVLGLLCGRRAILLTGDAGRDAERNWELAAYRGGVLKVGHHGSDTSTAESLLEALAPRHAVISVGHRNAFGLPRSTVIERLRDRGIAVYRTDRDGAITFSLGPRVRVRGERWRSGDGSR